MRYNTNMFNSGYKLSRNTIIALFAALVVVIALIAMARYFIVRDKRRAEQKPPAQSASITVSDEVLRSLTPPEGATSTPVSHAVLDSLTPPKNATSTAISQSVLNSLTPPV